MPFNCGWLSNFVIVFPLDVSSEITPSPQAEGTSRRDNYPDFTKEQDTIINELYEK